MDGGAWWVTKSRTQLSDFTFNMKLLGGVSLGSREFWSFVSQRKKNSAEAK